MRPYRVLLRGQGVFFAAQSSADCITSMAGFDLRQAQDLIQLLPPERVRSVDQLLANHRDVARTARVRADKPRPF
jgi:hypothetical protein